MQTLSDFDIRCRSVAAKGMGANKPMRYEARVNVVVFGESKFVVADGNNVLNAFAAALFKALGIEPNSIKAKIKSLTTVSKYYPRKRRKRVSFRACVFLKNSERRWEGRGISFDVNNAIFKAFVNGLKPKKA